jgi:hypothetical protein
MNTPEDNHSEIYFTGQPVPIRETRETRDTRDQSYSTSITTNQRIASLLNQVIQQGQESAQKNSHQQQGSSNPSVTNGDNYYNDGPPMAITYRGPSSISPGFTTPLPTYTKSTSLSLSQTLPSNYSHQQQPQPQPHHHQQQQQPIQQFQQTQTELILPSKVSYILILLIVTLFGFLVIGGIFVYSEHRLHHTESLHTKESSSYKKNHDEFTPKIQRNLAQLSSLTSIKKRNTKENEGEESQEQEEQEQEQEGNQEEHKDLEQQEKTLKKIKQPVEEMFVQVIDNDGIQKLFKNSTSLTHIMPSYKISGLGHCNIDQLVYKMVKIVPSFDKCKPLKSSIEVMTCCYVTMENNFMAHICKGDPPLILERTGSVRRKQHNDSFSLCLSCHIFTQSLMLLPSTKERPDLQDDLWWLAIGLSVDFINMTLKDKKYQGECVIKINAICTRFSVKFFFNIKNLSFEL